VSEEVVDEQRLRRVIDASGRLVAARRC